MFISVNLLLPSFVVKHHRKELEQARATGNPFIKEFN